MSQTVATRYQTGDRGPQRGAALLLLLGACAEEPRVEELVAGTIWAVPTQPAQVHAYIVKTDQDEAVLIDSGAEDDAASVLGQLDVIGLTADAITRVFLTHGHGDHIAGLAMFPEARVSALREEAGLIAGSEQPTRPLPSFGEPEPTGFDIDAAVEGGDVLQLGARTLEVFGVPGHTPGHAAYLVEGVLFLGDAATATDDGRLDNAPWLFSSDTEQNLDALRSLHDTLEPRAGEIEVIACAHSKPLRDGIAPLSALVATAP